MNRYGWIDKKGTCSQSELADLVKEYYGRMCIIFTVDKPVRGEILSHETDIDEEKLLEMRVFNENGELWVHRDSLGCDFAFRSTSENPDGDYEVFDEVQLLDIDLSKSNKKEGKLTAMGGGRYTLPITDDEDAVVVRNYISFSETTGRAIISDFRLLKFISTKDTGREDK